MINLIVAKAANNVIGRDNALPWHLPEDLAHFKRLTLGHPIIMGRKTYESIGRPLPQRRNLVITRNREWSAPGVESMASLAQAIAHCAEAAEVFIIGGAGIFSEALPLAQRLYVTELQRDYEGTVYFPAIPANFCEISREKHEAQTDPGLKFDFVTFEKT